MIDDAGSMLFVFIVSETIHVMGRTSHYFSYLSPLCIGSVFSSVLPACRGRAPLLAMDSFHAE